MTTQTLAKPGTPLTQTLALTITLDEEAPAEDSPWAATFTALGIPYDEELQRVEWSTGARRQKWAADSVTVADNSQLFYGHDWQALGLPIGKPLSAEQTPEGLLITGGISKTAKGLEVATLMRDGVLSKVSAGLTTSAWHIEEDGDLLVHDSSLAFEFSVVPQPAYDSADVTSINSHTPTPHKENSTVNAPAIDLATLATAADVQTLGETVTALERKVDTLPMTLAGAGAGAGASVPFTRLGDFAKAFVAGDQAARDLASFLALAMREQDAVVLGKMTTLAYSGGTTADLDGWLKASWIGDLFDLMMSPVNRKLTGFFGTQALPDTGMTVEYGTVATDTTAAGVQAAEGDPLVSGTLTFDVASAPVKTIGGMATLSVQQVNRSSMAIIEKFLRAIARKYAQTAEARVKTALTGATPHTLAGTGTHDLTTAAGWRNYFIDSAIYLEDTFGLTAEGVLLDYSMFRTLAGISEASANDLFLNRENGSIDVKGLEGDLYQVKLVPFSSGSSTFVRVAHSEAIAVLETASPTQLTDSDISNLTQGISLYGYQAVAVEEPDLLVAPDVTA